MIVNFSLALERDLRATVKSIAPLNGKSMNDFIVEAIREKIKNDKLQNTVTNQKMV